MSQAVSFAWRMPVEVHFGEGVSGQLGQVLNDQSAVVLAFEPASALGWRDRWAGELGSQLLTWLEVPDGLSSMARCREFSRRLWPILEDHPEAVLIALGGGTVLDIAKVLRCRPVMHDPARGLAAAGPRRTHPTGFEAVAAALRGRAAWPELALTPLWMVPTTAGTGSEVTRWATVWDTDQPPGKKLSFDEHFGFAQKAFVDPLLTHSCPASVTRDTALDALSHGLEAIWNRHANPISNALAVQAARQVLTWLPVVQRDPANAQARHALSLASLEAGYAFSQTRTALAHALSYAVTLEQGMPHGLACALWLPTAWALAQGRDAQVDRVLSQVWEGLVVEPVELGVGQAVTDIQRLQAWLTAVGVSCDPASHGVSDAAQRVNAALASPRGRNFIGA